MKTRHPTEVAAGVLRFQDLKFEVSPGCLEDQET